MDIKKKIIIKGQKVHDVGYRPFLLGIAESMEIERFYAKNVVMGDKQAVHVLIESSEEKVDAFIDTVSSEFPEISKVDTIDVEDFAGNVMKIESYYRFLTSMQLSKIALVGGKMLQQQNLHIEITRAGFHDVKSEIKDVKDELKQINNKIEEVHSDMNAGLADLKEEVHMQRDDLKEMFMKEVSALHSEINDIRSALLKMQQMLKV